MSKKWLIFDGDEITARGYNTMGRFAEDRDNGHWTIFGFFYAVLFFQHMYNTRNVIFCWKQGKSTRKKYVQKYENGIWRHHRCIAGPIGKKTIKEQSKLLRKEYLQFGGYQNIFSQKGYEAKDIIAKCCQSITDNGESAIVVSESTDLFQCISYCVSVHRLLPPTRPVLMDLRAYKSKYNISPKKWSTAAAILGTPSDNIIGIPGVSQYQVHQYIMGYLPEMNAVFRKLKSKENRAIIKRNRRITKLPLKGTRDIDIIQSVATKRSWNKLCERIEIPALSSLYYQHKGNTNE